MQSEQEVKQRLDKLISKARTLAFKPITIAEILYRKRIHNDIDLHQIETYRRPSTRWRNEIVIRLIGRPASLNSRYEDQLFDPAILPPGQLVVLGQINDSSNGMIEAYIYRKLLGVHEKVISIGEYLRDATADSFRLSSFLGEFENDAKLRRSVDKAYEILVYALFSALTKHLKATVTISVDNSSSDVLKDFEDFSQMVLGVDSEHPKISLPARLYRVGATNANDAGLDMWCNFGPAVQVKHITLSEKHISDIACETMSDKIVIVCKNSESNTIQMVLRQMGLAERVRGVINELELTRWYSIAFGKYPASVGTDLLKNLRIEFENEFPVGKKLVPFLEERGYTSSLLKGMWAIK